MKKTFLLLACTSAALLCACGGGESETAPQGNSAGGGSAISAPTEYLGAAANAKKSANRTIDTLALNNAIQLFGGEQGRYPKDLNELVEKKYLKEIPQPPHGMLIQYDPKSGSVKIVAK